MSEANTSGAERPDYDAVIAAALTSIAAQKAVTPAPAAAVAPAPAVAAAPAANAATEARERIKGILASDAGKTRPSLAHYLAFETDHSAEACAGILAKSPEEKPAAATDEKTELASALDKRMAQSGNAAGVKPDASIAKGRPDFVEVARASATKR